MGVEFGNWLSSGLGFSSPASELWHPAAADAERRDCSSGAPGGPAVPPRGVGKEGSQGGPCDAPSCVFPDAAVSTAEREGARGARCQCCRRRRQLERPGRGLQALRAGAGGAEEAAWHCGRGLHTAAGTERPPPLWGTVLNHRTRRQCRKVLTHQAVGLACWGPSGGSQPPFIVILPFLQFVFDSLFF